MALLQERLFDANPYVEQTMVKNIGIHEVKNAEF